jgi:hypothetical protein
MLLFSCHSVSIILSSLDPANLNVIAPFCLEKGFEHRPLRQSQAALPMGASSTEVSTRSRKHTGIRVPSPAPMFFLMSELRNVNLGSVSVRPKHAYSERD